MGGWLIPASGEDASSAQDLASGLTLAQQMKAFYATSGPVWFVAPEEDVGRRAASGHAAAGLLNT